MSAILALLLLSELFYGSDSANLRVAPPPQALYWEVSIYGAANQEEEFPLYLYHQGELIGLCGAPVHALQGSMSYCMTTIRYPVQGEIELSVETETAWVLEVNYYRAPHIYYLPSIGKETP